MTIRYNTFTVTAAAALWFACAPQALAEVNGDAVFAAFQNQMSGQGFEATSDSVSVDGDNVTINGLTVKFAGQEKELRIDKVLMEGVAETGNGSYAVGRVALPSFSDTRDGFTLNFDGAVVEGYVLAGPEETDPIYSIGLYRSAEIGAVAVAKDGNTIFTLDGITSNMGPYEAGGTMDMTADVNNFYVNLKDINDAKARAALQDLGYSELRGNMKGSGSWNTGSGDLSFKEAFMVDDAATLNIDVAIGGYTPELILAMKQMQKTMAASGSEAQGMAMLGLMQQIEIGNVGIEIVDNSATGRILDFIAKQQGTNRAGIIAQAKGALPFVLAQLQNPGFAAKATAAVGAYLDDPQSLKVTAAPAAPVPVAQIMAAVMSAPQSLIDVLAVTVTANE